MKSHGQHAGNGTVDEYAFPSPIVMQMWYNTHVFRESGEPDRSGTGEDRLPCPPRDRRQFCMTANTAFIGNTGHISRGNERHGCELCTQLGCLARFNAFVSSQTRASGECMGKGKCALFHASGTVPDVDCKRHINRSMANGSRLILRAAHKSHRRNAPRWV